MLYTLTRTLDFAAMAVTLWLAFYLLGRGFPSKIAMRGVLVLLALSAFFASAFINLFQQIPGATALRAVMLLIGLATWYSLTYQLLPDHQRRRLRWLNRSFYLLAFITALLLTFTPAFVDEKENLLWVGRMGFGLPYLVYGIYQVLGVAGILYNLLSGDRIGLKPQGRFLLLASCLPMLAVVYGVLALAIMPPHSMPRLAQDLLIFSGVTLLGVSVARYQLLVERRTTLQDLPISGLLLLGVAAIYGLLAWLGGMGPELMASVTVLAILTHSFYDLGREFLERLRIRKESTLRRQLRQIESGITSEESLGHCLQEVLELLCQTLRASGGFIAIRQGETYTIAASHRSLSTGRRLQPQAVECQDLCQPPAGRLKDIAWLAPLFEAGLQVAVIGLALPMNRLGYSQDDLDLLAEVAEHAANLVALSSRPSPQAEKLRLLAAEMETKQADMRLRADELMATMTSNPPSELVKMVEEGLRQLPDYISLGQLGLVDWVDVEGDSHIERGKQLQGFLTEAIESLRPPGPRPEEPLPRVWHNYIVLHDAYVECVPNREIMARLYISEGTFNRTRRNALRGLARLLLEREKRLPRMGWLAENA
jgi:hypothetical protein